MLFVDTVGCQCGEFIKDFGSIGLARLRPNRTVADIVRRPDWLRQNDDREPTITRTTRRGINVKPNRCVIIVICAPNVVEDSVKEIMLR